LPSLFRFHFILFIALTPAVGLTAEDWGLCTAPTVTRNNVTGSSVTQVEADQLESENSRFYQFSGDVRLFTDSKTLNSDFISLDRQTSVYSAQGNLHYSDQTFRLNAQQMELNDQLNSSRFEQADFQLYENHFRGSARQIVQLNENQSELFDVSYTTCDPGKNSWSLSTGKLSLDQQDGRGTALHAVLKIKGIPVFYFPWFQFPIDDRRMSGLLTPTVSLSNIDGYQLNLPFYWNLAENYDMTLTPVFYKLRGTQLNTENRYLLENQSGQLNLSWMNDDITQSERWFGRWSHQADFADDIHTSILIQKMSDGKFGQDFGHLNYVEDVDYLQSSATLSTLLANWNTQILFEEYQTLNEEKSLSSRPYKRLPRITFDRTFNASEHALTLNWKNEWVSFDKEQSLVGNRLHLAPVISYPIEQSYFFFKPSLQLDYTAYSLDNSYLADSSNTKPDRLTRSVPLLSIDSGLIFERLANSSRNWTQTLEPRLYLLYVPYRDQSDFPDFDTSLLSESYQTLFINNRFSGADRIGDSRQISLGLTTRLLNQQNRQLFSASISQALYAEDRRVSLDSTIDKRKKSSLMTLISFQPQPQWDIQLSSVYDTLLKTSTQTDISIRQHHDAQAFNIEYHFRKDKLEQSTISLVYPMSVNWSVFAKQQHSILHDKPVQNLFGLAYESCCWKFKVLYEESSDKNFENTDQVVYFQLTLKGLGSAGKDINSVLENGILGYRPRF